MRILVCGSRTWTDWETISHRLKPYPEATILSGMAKGPDTYAVAYAGEHGLTLEKYPANWAEYGKAAGIIRNNEMLDTMPDLVLAFWDGKSRGTAHTVHEAIKRGIPTTVIHEQSTER